jgi:phosphoglycerate kinase
MRKLTVRDLDVVGKRVLLRTDFNVDVVGGRVRDDLRIEESLPTLRALRAAGSRVVICSHRGRPEGRPDPTQSNLPLTPGLSRLLGTTVRFASDCVGPEAEAVVAALHAGDVALLENLRFHPGEEANDDEFARRLASLGDAYVNDAFGVLHRAHASIVGVPRYLPSAAGLLVEREVDRLRQVAESPEHPFALILGGAKVPDKLPLLEHLLPTADVVCLGGAMANAVLAVQGIDIAASVAHAEGSHEAAERLLDALALRRDLRLVLPRDVVVAPSVNAKEYRTVSVSEVPAGWYIVDIGPQTIREFESAIRGARTAIWNGPVGVFEQPPFDRGTRAVALMLAELGGRTVVGGGATAAAVRSAGLAERIWHLSTGGGAALQLLAGRALPGVDALPVGRQNLCYHKIPSGSDFTG